MRSLVYFSQSGAGTRFFHVDALGSVGYATCPTGIHIEAMLYYPYGSTWQDTAGAIWDERFAGMPIADADFQQYATLARQYSPALGRWMTPDPAGLAAIDPSNPDTFNRYSYVLNKPASMIDPSGLIESTLPGGLDAITELELDKLSIVPNWLIPQVHVVLQQPPGATAKKQDCDNPKYSKARQFVKANQSAANQIAAMLQTTAGSVLGLSGFESGWGTGFLITAGTNNYFSLTAGNAFGGTIGTYQHGSYTYGVYPSPGFLTSGQSFANSYFGARVNGITDPLAFAQALNHNGNFNSETLPTPYDEAVANTINLANRLLPCP